MKKNNQQIIEPYIVVRDKYNFILYEYDPKTKQHSILKNLTRTNNEEEAKYYFSRRYNINLWQKEITELNIELKSKYEIVYEYYSFRLVNKVSNEILFKENHFEKFNLFINGLILGLKTID